MKGKALQILSAVFGLSLVIGCATTGPQVPILKPQLIDQKEAKEKLITRYCDVVAKTARMGFDPTAICTRFQKGELKLSSVKSSGNDRYVLYLFEESEAQGSAKGDYSLIAFYFNPLSELLRKCSDEGVCDVYLRNGVTRFGRTNVIAYGEPAVHDSGITVKFKDDRSFAYDLLFAYMKSNQREGDELISLFLSAYPFLFYQ
jgi:hypothetical protein